MKYLFLILIFSFSIFSQAIGKVEQSSFLSHWKVVLDGHKEGNSIRSLERQIVTPYSKYTVAQVTMVEFTFTGDKSLESTREFLKKEFKLTGLKEMKLGEAMRFEGYREDINRQVVIFVSFIPGKIKVSSSFYRPSYGRTIALESELFHRKYHSAEKKVSYLKFLQFSLPLIQSAYAQQDCTKCAGNPVCLMLCRSANSGSSTGGGFFGDLGNMNLGKIEAELSATNTQLNVLNGNLGLANQNWGTTNNQIGNINSTWGNTNNQIANANGNWDNTNSQLNNFNNNWADTNTQIGVFNNNYAKTNEELAKANQNLEHVNKNLENMTNVVDQKAQAALEESQAWRAMTEKESAEWKALMKEQTDRGLTVAEKMSDPNHLFKVATFSAAGAVLGATVANLAITGVQKTIGFLIKWATGELKTMKQEELLKEFSEAMKVYNESSAIAKGLEASIDSVLANLALHEKFQLENSEILANIQKYILATEFEIEDARANRCVDDLVTLNQKMVEFQSLARILDMSDPQRQMCLELKEMFRKIAEIEGVLQNARPNLLKAEEALNWQKARAQNESAKILERIRRGDLAEDVFKTQDRQRRRLYEQNVKDTRRLVDDIKKDCRASFNRMGLKRKDLNAYCESLLTDQAKTTDESIRSSFPSLTDAQREKVLEEFEKKYIPLGLDKVRVYQEQREQLFTEFQQEMNRHREVSENLSGRLQLDPRIALEEMKAINEFAEKLMKEQAYIYSDGLRVKKARFEEACQSMN